MPTKTFTPLLGKRIRVTVLDECGEVPVAATADSVLVTSGFVTVSLSSEIEDGTEIVTKRADGAICVNEKFAGSFKRFNVEMEFCGANPSLLAMVTNVDAYENYDSEVAGFTVAEGFVTTAFAFELWTGLAGQACTPGETAGGYMVLPFVQGGTIGDLEFGGEDAVNFSMTGAYTRGGNTWGVGPYDVAYNASSIASPLPTALDPYDHLLMMTTGLAAPPAADSPIPMPA